MEELLRKRLRLRELGDEIICNRWLQVQFNLRLNRKEEEPNDVRQRC